MKKLGLLLMSIIAMGFMSCTSDESTESSTGSIYGVVTVKETAEPMRATGVELYYDGSLLLKTVTYDDGHYEFENLMEGEYVLNVVASGYEDATYSVFVEAGRTARADMQLVRQTFVETTAGLNMKMVYVEGGEFLMGATSEQGSDAYNDEQVIRRVTLNSYYIGECEITQSQWEKVMGTSIQQQASKAGTSNYRGIGSDYPMYYVSWEEAQAFCSELSRMTGKTYCLPTEAQWEYAARGGKKADGTKYSGSWSIDAVAWYDGNSGSSTHPVKNKRPNGLGLYDMSGNVWEWCSDWYGNSYNVNDTNNPVGPSSGSNRVLRGGGWGYSSRFCRVSSRGSVTPGLRGDDFGFRVVLLP